MAFYSPNWVRKLVKEDANHIADYVSKKRGGKFVNDFRGYIDSTLPFVLWLDMKEIRDKVLDSPATTNLIKSALANLYSGNDLSKKAEQLKAILEKAYIKVINDYQSNSRYIKVPAKNLENMLREVTEAPVGEVQNAINKNFSRTIVVTNVSVPNKSVMLILPKFTTVTFGTDFRDAIDYSILGGDSDTWDSPQNLVKNLLLDTSGAIGGKKQTFFAQLQNVGHIEVDVVSEVDNTVKRGQNSPRLLQALLATPKSTNAIDRLQAQFSKETLQASTRVKIRKRFKGSKLVFEMLVEYGFPVGIPETQEINLKKARKELEFDVGSGLTAQIRNNPQVFVELETSKSYKAYVVDNLFSLLTKGKQAPSYSSDANFIEKTPVTINKVKLKLPKKVSGSFTPNSSKSTIDTKKVSNNVSLTSLQILLNTHLQDVISANMGNGSERSVLNYRTGRLAASAKVERLTSSKDGMISAFYSYMRNPYGTFSEGGKQQFPRSRDPKLLISQSIKEIAVTRVANRMRAVLV